MKVLLIAMNAKYIHSNLAVYDLRAYSEVYCRQRHIETEIAEYTINQPEDDVLMDIYERKADIVCFSCYIWNRTQIGNLIEEYHKIAPQTPIWAGGPEVSYDAPQTLRQWPGVSLIMNGEGEQTFLELLKWQQEDGGRPERLGEIAGITWRSGSEMKMNPPRPVMNLNAVPFVYDRTGDFSHKIIYYESSRGCPFSCSYCLSSIDKQLRFRDTDTVLGELQHFLDLKVPQVKFVDRTFNCRHEHSKKIWRYLRDHDNGVTNFHFEIAADLIDEEELQIMAGMRPGLIQLEIGVQSTNKETIREIRRTMDFEKVAAVVGSIQSMQNIHLHLDLIAGLPFEDMSSFRHSFDQVYGLKPDDLQLGFLKVLKGSWMAEKQTDYALQHKATPPYEVLTTRWLSYDDILLLKKIENVLEIYYNSGQYVNTMNFLEQYFESPFTLYEKLARFYIEDTGISTAHKRSRQYEILLEFAAAELPGQERMVRELLILDYYLRENAKTRPQFAGPEKVTKAEQRGFYETEAEQHRFLEGYPSDDRNQLRRMTHLERFDLLDKTLLFDYQNRSPMTRSAKTFEVQL